MADLLLELRRLREEAGLSQDALAERLGVTREHVSRIERSKTQTNVDKAAQWAEACGYDLMLVPRERPGARALLAELEHSTEEERAVLIRLSRLFPRLDERSRQIAIRYIEMLDEMQLEDDRRDVEGRRPPDRGPVDGVRRNLR